MRIIRQAIIEGFKTKLIREQQKVFNRESKYSTSLDGFSDSLEQVDFQIRFLAGLIYRIAKESDLNTGNSILVLHNPEEIADFLYKQDADCVMLTSPEHMPVVLKRKGTGWVQDADEFADWLMVNWASDILVITML